MNRKIEFSPNFTTRTLSFIVYSRTNPVRQPCDSPIRMEIFYNPITSSSVPSNVKSFPAGTSALSYTPCSREPLIDSPVFVAYRKIEIEISLWNYFVPKSADVFILNLFPTSFKKKKTMFFFQSNLYNISALIIYSANREPT